MMKHIIQNGDDHIEHRPNRHQGAKREERIDEDCRREFDHRPTCHSEAARHANDPAAPGADFIDCYKQPIEPDQSYL